VRYLSLAEVLDLHRRVIAGSGGATPLRDLGGLESSVAQPRASYGGEDLYPDLASKATALAFSLINNHPFVDGNKRVGHAALETFLLLNGFEISATIDEGEAMILSVAAGQATRDELLQWVRDHMVSAR
jgi:death-on-curing protein